jgi:dTMP kinase
MQRGLFITFEGLDGCGKTTQIRLLAQALRDRGRAVVETAEPGGTDIGRQIRRILLDPANQAIHSRTELLLYFGSRAQNVEEVIRPSLSRGRDVICDRFTDSTVVYQGCGRGLDTQVILDLDRIACDGLAPDVTLLIDIDLATSIRRARRRNERAEVSESRIDEESLAFHDRVRRGYLGLANQYPERFRVINGRASIEEVAESVWKAVAAHV